MQIDENPQQTLREYELSGQIAEVLLKHYPFHLWYVNVDMRGGIVQVFNARLSGKWGFILHLTNVLNDPTWKTVINAGGELLERYRMHRGKFSETQYQGLATNSRGELLVDK